MANRLLAWLSIAALMSPGRAAIGSIKSVSFAPNEPAACMEAGLPALAQGVKRRLRVEGSWTDWARSVTASGGVTGRVLRSSAAPSWVDIELQAAPDAAPGRSQVVLDYPLARDSFQVMVIEQQRIESVRPAGRPQGAFRFMHLGVSGRHLEASLAPQVELVTRGAGPVSRRAGGLPGGRVIVSQFIRQSDTRGRVEIEFFEPMEQAVVVLELHSRDARRSCRPLRYRTAQPIVVPTPQRP